MFFKKIFKPKIKREKLEELRKIAFKFDNQIFTESNHDFLYDELDKFNNLANSYIKQTNKVVCKDLCQLQISHQKRDLHREYIIESEEKNNRISSPYFFEMMIKVIDFILEKHEVKE